MSIRERVISGFKARRQRILDGKINSIPSPFVRFREDFLGVEQKKYYVITSSTKGAKTQFSSFMFIYNPLMYAYEHPDIIRVKVFYYPLEETPEDVLTRFMSYILYIKKGVKVSPTDLNSTRNERPVSQEVLDMLDSEEIRNIIDFFEANVIFSKSSNPTGVYNECKTYARENGRIHTRKQKIKTNEGDTTEVDVFDYYEQNDPDEYRIIFIDHVSLLTQERQMTLKQCIDKLSEYLVSLRNDYGFTPVVIQQQAFAGESLDAYKENKVRPTIANLADSKYPSRDCNVCMGLFSPLKHDIKLYEGYDITKLKDNVRFLELLINRSGSPGGLIALYFDGAVCNFAELPLPTDKPAIQRVYDALERRRANIGTTLFSLGRLISKIRKKNYG